MFSAIFSALTSKVAGPIAAIIAVTLGLALGESRIVISVLRGELATAQNTVGQLKGSLDFQNQMVTELGQKSASATLAAKTALAAVRAADFADGTRAAALVAAPVPSDPVLACTHANDTIKSFFDPQPAGAQ